MSNFRKGVSKTKYFRTSSLYSDKVHCYDLKYLNFNYFQYHPSIAIKNYNIFVYKYNRFIFNKSSKNIEIIKLSILFYIYLLLQRF